MLSTTSLSQIIQRGKLLISFASGLRFDLVAVIYVNASVILLHLLPFPFRSSTWYQKLLTWFYFISNSIALFFAMVDLKWFGFVGKRMTFGIFGTARDMIDQLPVYLRDYWYMLLIYGITIGVMIWSDQKIRSNQTSRPDKISYPFQMTLLILFLGMSVIGIRGGLQHKPLIPISAAAFASPSLIEVTLNTPFNILLTVQSPEMTTPKYFDEEKLKQLFTIQHVNDVSPDSMRHENVVIIIWESLSRNFMGALNHGTGHTPFLDSLAKEGLLCTNAMANAHRSIEGMPAVVASIPTLMEESFSISQYQQDRFEGLAAVLKKFGYSSAFYHGGKNGIMSFDVFALASGYDHYYGLNEYPEKKDFDGTMGVWDEPYLQYVSEQISIMKQPFFTTVFTVTSHYPFKVPSQYKELFKQEEQNSYYHVMRYTDYALRNFFERASGQPWYNNTLFIISADHGAWDPSPVNNTPHGGSSIPILFYKPGGSLKGICSKPVQQVDILPSVIDYLHLPCNYASFGKSVFGDDSIRYSFNYLNGIYHIEDHQYHLEFDGNNTLSMFDYRNDSLFTKNLIGMLPAEQRLLEDHLKAVIQTYHDALIHNRLMPE